MKSILITGCSSGIGFDCAYYLRERGWRVFASCRQQADCARLQQAGFDSPLLDHTDPATVSAALATVLTQTGGRLDAVFNNGAFAIPGAAEDLPTPALREIFEANFFGYHEVMRQVLPIMRAQGGGHILNCSSVLGFAAMRWRGAYNASKYALEGLCDTMRLELRGSGIHVVLIQPGPITTKIRENSIPHFERWIDVESSPNKARYNSLRQRLYGPSQPDYFELPPRAVSEKVLAALRTNTPKARYRVTTLTHIAAGLKRLLSTRAMDRILSRI